MTSTDPNIAICQSCGTMIDVSEEEPFALVNCSSCGARMRVRQDFANFELQGILGEGGQGIAYRAVDKKLNRPVAVKVMKREYSADPDFVKRFESEARITASLNNPHIVKVFSSGEYQGLIYLAMEIVDHGSLDALMAQLKKMPEEQAIDIGIQIATGLKAGLELGLIHRDIKPGNILFADRQTAKIVDFGLAILVEKQHEEQGDVWATPYYVAPEKLDGQPEDFRSDMYSLAATLFHALAGRPPFISESNSMAELRRIKSQPVRLLNFAPHVSTPTAYAIDRALSFKPEDRFESYGRFIESLEFARAELRKNPAKRRTPRVLMIGEGMKGGSWATFAIVAGIVAVGVYFWTHRPGVTGKGATGTQAGSESADADLTAEMRFDLGRKHLVEEHFTDAAKIFRILYEEGRLPEPKNSWAAVHWGLAELFAGKSGPAKMAFKTLAERATPTVIGLDAKLVAFFKQLSVPASGKPKDGQPKLDDFDPTTYESLAFLVAGLKQWDAGDFEAAITTMRHFQKATPAGEDAWVADYRPLVRPYLDDYGMYREIVDDIAKADTSPKIAEAALRKIPAAKDKLRTDRLRKELETLETEGGEKVRAALAAAENAIKQQRAEAEAREDRQLTAAKLQIKDLCENYRFTEAASLIRAVDVKLDRSIGERDLVAKRVDWLVEFKKHLLEDINAAGCTVPLLKKNGQKLLGTVSRADDNQLELRVQFGTLPAVKWIDISPLSILQMARTFMRATLSQAALADREWQAAVFCLFTGLFNEGQALMDDAVTRKPDYQNDRALFFGQSAPTPAPDPAQPAPAPASGIEMADQPLNPSSKPKTSPLLNGVPAPAPQ
ncbi:MAG: serine/threonine-protein kinase [Chthoniobacteraceae bacterium]